MKTIQSVVTIKYELDRSVYKVIKLRADYLKVEYWKIIQYIKHKI